LKRAILRLKPCQAAVLSRHGPHRGNADSRALAFAGQEQVAVLSDFAVKAVVHRKAEHIAVKLRLDRDEALAARQSATGFHGVFKAVAENHAQIRVVYAGFSGDMDVHRHLCGNRLCLFHIKPHNRIDGAVLAVTFLARFRYGAEIIGQVFLYLSNTGCAAISAEEFPSALTVY